jgi:hypothetical protein
MVKTEAGSLLVIVCMKSAAKVLILLPLPASLAPALLLLVVPVVAAALPVLPVAAAAGRKPLSLHSSWTSCKDTSLRG